MSITIDEAITRASSHVSTSSRVKLGPRSKRSAQLAAFKCWGGLLGMAGAMLVCAGIFLWAAALEMAAFAGISALGTTLVFFYKFVMDSRVAFDHAPTIGLFLDDVAIRFSPASAGVLLGSNLELLKDESVRRDILAVGRLARHTGIISAVCLMEAGMTSAQIRAEAERAGQAKADVAALLGRAASDKLSLAVLHATTAELLAESKSAA